MNFSNIDIGTVFNMGGQWFKKVSDTEYRRFCSYNRSLITVDDPEMFIEGVIYKEM